jgi:LysR family nitrogen assimilation transcriptional regulator
MPSPPDVSRVLLNHTLESAGLSPTIVAEVDDVPSSLAAVRAGLGGTVLPTGNLSGIGGADLPRPALIEPPMYLTASIVCDSDTPLSRAAEAVRTMLVSLVKSHLETEQLPGTEWLGQS